MDAGTGTRKRHDEVTVLIPTKDRKDLVLQAIESVSHQTELPGNLMVVDDGSTDGTADAISALSDFPIPIEVVQGPGVGVGPARNCGLQRCRTPLVCFLDSDDLLREDAIERGMASWSDGLAMLIFSGTRFPGEFDEVLTKPTAGDAFSLQGLLGHESDFNPPWGLASVEALLAVDGFSTELPCAVDYDLLLRLCASGKEIECLRDPVYRYRIAQNRETVSGNQARNWRSRLQALDRLNQLFPKEVQASAQDYRTIRIRFLLRLCKALRAKNRLSGNERSELRAAAIEAFRIQCLRVRLLSNLLTSLIVSLVKRSSPARSPDHASVS
jgi:glycosyltransferase involved in cell wall biosynthesis